MIEPLRIAVCVKADLAGCILLNHLLDGLLSGGPHQVTVLLSGLDRPAEHHPSLLRLRRFERDYPLQHLFPALERYPDRGSDLQTVRELRSQYVVPITAVAQVNDGDGRRIMEQFAPDLIISARFSLIFADHMIKLPRLGIVNIHPGELPQHAGLFAPFWARFDGESSIGCTLHRIDRGIDTGPILGVDHLPVHPTRSVAWHAAHTYPLGVRTLLDLLPDLAKGPESLPGTAQNRADRRYRSLPDPAELRLGRARGIDLLATGDVESLYGPFAGSAQDVLRDAYSSLWP